MIETKKTEIRYTTSDPFKMLNRFLAKRLLKTWIEDFVDEDTGSVISIERHDVLFERGMYIDQDNLAKIRFHIEAGDIKEVEVSNQKRLAVENQNTYFKPYVAQAQIKDKKYKFLLYANSLDVAMLILKDYIELNYADNFTLMMVKEFDSCVILTDTLKERKIDTLPDNWEEGDLSVALDENKPEERKFYQIESKITFDEDEETFQTFVVHTFNVDRAMMVITDYLIKRQNEDKKSMEEKELYYDVREIHAMVETAKILPVGRFIPKEFSIAYDQR